MISFVLLSLLESATAFAPTATTLAEPNRVRRYRAIAQTRLAHQPAWDEFLAGDGVGWQARFDEETGTAHRAWGPAIALPPIRDGASAERVLRAFFARNPGILGVDEAELRLANATWDATMRTWYVAFERTIDGVPIWRAGVTARIRDGKLALFGVDTYPAVHHIGNAELTAEAAILAAGLDGPASLGDHRDESASLVALPVERQGRVSLVLAWKVHSRTATPLGKWVSFVDAGSGTLLSVSNEILFATGFATGRIDTRTVDGNMSDAPLPFLAMGTTFAGADGSFDVFDDEYRLALKGSYLTVRNAGGAEGSLSWSGGALYWTEEDATQAEIDSYKALHDVRAWGAEIAPDNRMSIDVLVSNVNSSEDVCNAYYDGSVNFYEKGGGCSNTGRIADVNYHEWGHGFHYNAVRTGVFDGSLSEGAGDTVSAIQTGDSLIGPYFQTNGDPVRDVAPNRVYPDDVQGEVHEDGLIFAGAVWDVGTLLHAEYGETRPEHGEAWRTLSTLFAATLKAGPTIEESYDEFIFADDDDGDLTNGTPHACAIIEGFGEHGLGPLGDGTGPLAIDHEAIGNQPSGSAIVVSGGIRNVAAGCVEVEGESAAVVYSVDGRVTWQRAPLTISGEALDGQFPNLADGTVVDYYLSVDSSEGEALSPAGGEIAPYTFYVGELEEIWCAEFGGDDDGLFTHELLSGRDGDGADDWIFGTPGGYATDPEDAFTGRKVWGNDLGGGNFNGEYQAGIVNRLSSPAIPTAGEGDIILQYRRWLGVEDGFYDRARVYANDGIVWENHNSGNKNAAEATLDEEWILHTVRVPSPGETLTLAWEIESDGGLQYGGWNIDDVCVYRSNLSVGVTDFVASDDIDESVELEWTQPLGTSQALVVRRTDRFAAAVHDGEVVYNGRDLAEGTPISASDAFVGEAYYAVFTGDGTAWSTGFIEGSNADKGTGRAGADGGAGDGGDLRAVGSCGCNAAGGSWAWGSALATMLAARRRRWRP